MPLVKRLATFILRVKNKRVVFKVYAFSKVKDLVTSISVKSDRVLSAIE